MNEEYEEPAAGSCPAKGRVYVFATPVPSLHEAKPGLRRQNVFHLYRGNVMLVLQLLDDRLEPYDALDPHVRTYAG